MSTLRTVGRLTGWACIAIGGIQLVGGTRGEPGMTDDATVDSHVRFMGPVFAGYGVAWLDAVADDEPNLDRMRLLAGLMALGGSDGSRPARPWADRTGSMTCYSQSSSLHRSSRR